MTPMFSLFLDLPELVSRLIVPAAAILACWYLIRRLLSQPSVVTGPAIAPVVLKDPPAGHPDLAGVRDFIDKVNECESIVKKFLGSNKIKRIVVEREGSDPIVLDFGTSPKN